MLLYMFSDDSFIIKIYQTYICFALCSSGGTQVRDRLCVRGYFVVNASPGQMSYSATEGRIQVSGYQQLT